VLLRHREIVTPDFREGRQVALDRSISLFISINGAGRQAAFERIRDELPCLNRSDFSLEFREGYESGRELALCRIADGEGDPRKPMSDERRDECAP
jgi:hypothetical protein